MLHKKSLPSAKYIYRRIVNYHYICIVANWNREPEEMKYNDLDIKNWKELDINVDSLWIIGERDKSGKHANVYHGNFIPQIPNQLIRRYTKENEIVLDPFLGSGTTLFECEKLNRKFIGFDINAEIIEYVNSKMSLSNFNKFEIYESDVTNEKSFIPLMEKSIKNLKAKKVQFVIMHPPYMDIVKFTNKKEDLSQITNLSEFIKVFLKAVKNAITYLEKNRYFAIVIGDVYKNSEVIPLGFYVLDAIKRNFKTKLKGIIVKNIEGNRGNTMITIYESERLIKLIRDKNKRNVLNSIAYTFNEVTQQIETTQNTLQYNGRKETIKILPRLINKYCNGKQFETHLQAYIIQNLESLPFTNQPIEWIGNEVSCGVGMQRIDIMLSINSQNRKVIPIELKSVEAYPEIIIQLQRYIDWIEQYYLPNRPSDIEPMIISREITDKTTQSYQDLINGFNNFNAQNNILKLRYVEFSIDCTQNTIIFNEITY